MTEAEVDPPRPCCVCTRPLADTEPQTCERCHQTTQQTLKAITALWAELPDHLGHAPGQAYDRDGRGGAEEHQLPGGALIALLGPGSDGGAPSKWGDRSHAADQLPSDTPSVLWTLEQWMQDWHIARGWTDFMPAHTVPALATYLEQHGRWAANTHPAYGDYAQELAELLARLEQATSRQRKPVQAGAACFDCGGTLIRPVQDGLEVEDVVKCRQCGETYTGARYLLALAQRREEGLSGWVTYHAAAQVARRPLATLWAWVQRLQVPAVCRVEDRAVLVWYPDVHERTTSAARRKEVP